MPSLLHLSSDEVRLIMRMCEFDELLRFARCTRRLYADADSPWVWSHREVWCDDVDNSFDWNSSRILRHQPLKVQFNRVDDELKWVQHGRQ